MQTEEKHDIDYMQKVENCILFYIFIWKGNMYHGSRKVAFYYQKVLVFSFIYTNIYDEDTH